MNGIIYGERVHLRIGFFERPTEDIHQHSDQIRLLQQQFHDFLKRHNKRVRLFKRHSSVGTHLLRGGEFSNNITPFAHVVNHFTSTGAYRSNLYDAVLEKEERPLLMSHVVNHLMLIEGCRLAIWTNQIAYLRTYDGAESSRNCCSGIYEMVRCEQ